MTRDLDGKTPLMATMQNIQVVTARKQQSLSASGARNVPYFERPFSDPIGPDTPPLHSVEPGRGGGANGDHAVDPYHGHLRHALREGHAAACPTYSTDLRPTHVQAMQSEPQRAHARARTPARRTLPHRPPKVRSRENAIRRIAP